MRWSVVEAIVDGLSPATILEIGCGQGGFGARLARRGVYLGVEPDPLSCGTAVRRIAPLGGEVRNVSWSDIEPGRTFDLVCAFEVLEHLDDDQATLEAWRTLISPGGSLLVSMPAWAQRFNAWDVRVGHKRRYEPNSTAQLLVSAGYSDPRIVVYDWPLGYLLETGRARFAARRVTSRPGDGHLSMEARTARSGRVLQPSASVGRLTCLGVQPFLVLQRRQPGRGTGLVAVARRALASG